MGGWVVNATPRPLLHPGNTRYLLYKKLGGVPGTVWTCVENLAPTRIRSPDRPACSESLYRLSYHESRSVNWFKAAIWDTQTHSTISIFSFTNKSGSKSEMRLPTRRNWNLRLICHVKQDMLIVHGRFAGDRLSRDGIQQLTSFA